MSYQTFKSNPWFEIFIGYLKLKSICFFKLFKIKIRQASRQVIKGSYIPSALKAIK